MCLARGQGAGAREGGRGGDGRGEATAHLLAALPHRTNPPAASQAADVAAALPRAHGSASAYAAFKIKIFYCDL